MKLIDNASGNVSESVTLDSSNKADKYKLSYNCSSIGSGKSYIRIYATLSDNSYRTYFMPIQFTGVVSFELGINNDTTFLQFDMIGDAILTEITLETVVDATMEYVKENSKFWDKIKEVVNSTGKLRSELLEGIINTSLNKIMAPGYLNEGNTSVWETETEATMINPDGMYRANSKMPDGAWDWKPFTVGAGINADAIVAGILRAITISGVDITGSSITGGVITGTKIQGGEVFIGSYNLKEDGSVDITSFTGTHITMGGIIRGYNNGTPTYYLTHTAEGRMAIGTDVESYGGVSFEFDSIYDNDYCAITARNNSGMYLNTSGVRFKIGTSGVEVYTAGKNGTFYVEGNIDCTGSIRALGGIS